jgi:uncharacterized protein (DUF362 family)
MIDAISFEVTFINEENNMNGCMGRRRFMKNAAILTVGAGLPGGLNYLVSEALADVPPDLAVVQGGLPATLVRAGIEATLVRAGIEAMGGMKRFVSRGDVVVVKPNMAWDRTPEQAANTNPEVLAEVVRLCFDAGAREVKVFDRSVNSERRCYVQSGIKEAAEKLGAKVKYVDDRKFRRMDLKGGVLRQWPMYTEVMEADKVINVPIAKHHGLARLTMCMKNWMGVMGGSRSRIHQKLDHALVDLARFVKPTLSVLDAVRVLTANGPQGGRLADVRRLDTIVVGVDQVAIDAFGSTLFGLKPDALGYVREGVRSGLGRADIENLRIAKLDV